MKNNILRTAMCGFSLAMVMFGMIAAAEASEFRNSLAAKCPKCMAIVNDYETVSHITMSDNAVKEFMSTDPNYAFRLAISTISPEVYGRIISREREIGRAMAMDETRRWGESH